MSASAIRYSILLILFTTMVNAQDSPWDRWDAELVSSLYTSKEVPYLNEEEKKVILFMNMARNDGYLFSETFLNAFVEEKQLKNTKYLKSLYRDLKKIKGLSPLYPEEDLTAVAQNHAVKSGKTGHVGHRDMNKRFAHLKGNPYYAWGENCAYGYDEALTIVITLLIDEGVEKVGHRRNILNESYNSVGVAIRPHKTYRVNCVMDFGQKDRSDLNTLPF